MLLMLGCAKNGSDGAAGSVGAAGVAGASMKFTKAMDCFGTISGQTGAAGTALNGLRLAFHFNITSSGDALAEAEVFDAGFQNSGTAFYSSNQAGSKTGTVIITADYATPNGGFWNIQGDMTAGVFTVVYTDTTLGVQSPVTMISNTSACTVRTF